MCSGTSLGKASVLAIAVCTLFDDDRYPVPSGHGCAEKRVASRCDRDAVLVLNLGEDERVKGARGHIEFGPMEVPGPAQTVLGSPPRAPESPSSDKNKRCRGTMPVGAAPRRTRKQNVIRASRHRLSQRQCAGLRGAVGMVVHCPRPPVGPAADTVPSRMGPDAGRAVLGP